MLVLGLTGSIAMGKSATAAMFGERGVPIHDADAAVHRLYRDAKVAEAIEAELPGATANRQVERQLLSRIVIARPDALGRLEAIVHPLVRASQATFLKRAGEGGHPIVLLDIPLLFETGRAAEVDVVITATAAAAIQHARVMSRPGMTPDKLAALMSRQMPDTEKRRRAHFLVDTGHGFEAARRQVDAILRALAFTV